MTKSQKILTFTVILVLAFAIVTTVSVIRGGQQRRAEARAMMETGIAQFRQEQYEQALETFSGIPENAIENWRVPYYSGSAMINLKDYQSAAEELEKALALNSQEENVLFALGVVYYKLGNLPLSKGYFAAVLEIHPAHEEAKGLMDIMAGLERYNTGQEQAEYD